MKRRFYYFSILFISMNLLGCQNKSASSTPTEGAETNTTVDQVKINAAIEEYEEIAQAKIDQLNEAIKSEKLNSVEDIMRFYAPEDKHAEGKYTYDISVLQMSNSTITLVTLVEEGINDDSIRAKKVVLTIRSVDGQHEVTKIKQSYQCWEGRGHTQWSASYCS